MTENSTTCWFRFYQQFKMNIYRILFDFSQLMSNDFYKNYLIWSNYQWLSHFSEWYFSFESRNIVIIQWAKLKFHSIFEWCLMVISMCYWKPVLPCTIFWHISQVLYSRPMMKQNIKKVNEKLYRLNRNQKKGEIKYQKMDQVISIVKQTKQTHIFKWLYGTSDVLLWSSFHSIV